VSRHLTFDPATALRLLKEGLPVAVVAARLGCARNSLYVLMSRSGVSSGVRAHLRSTKIAAKPVNYSANARNKDLPPERYLDRDPCDNCGVPEYKHPEHGCCRFARFG
jgi:hypothetical protein